MLMLEPQGDDLLGRQARWHRGIPLTPSSPAEGLG
jgi:hypothetical protein